MNPAKALSGELKKMHDDFGYTSETMIGGRSTKATMARAFIQLFRPLAEKMRAGTAGMGTNEVIQRVGNSVVHARSRRDLVGCMNASKTTLFQNAKKVVELPRREHDERFMVEEE